jgi:multidrug efflux pump
VGWAIRLSAIVILAYLGVIALTGFGFTAVPSGFIPVQDKGRLIVNIQLPDSAALERTVEVTKRIEQMALDTPGVAHTISAGGRSFVLNAVSSNLASMFITLAPFDQRRNPSLSADAIAATLRAKYQKEILEARTDVYGAPAVDGLGNAGGFRLMIESIGDVDFKALQGQADNICAKGAQLPGVAAMFNGFRAATPQLYIDIDRTKAKTMKLQLSDVFDTLQVYLGSFYTNDFNRFGRTWQVNLQADAPFRADAESVKQLKCRNADGEMVPLGSVADIRDAAGPLVITRYNMFPSATINGAAKAGASTGDVLHEIDALCDQELPDNMRHEWSELAYMQAIAGKVETFRDLQQNPFSAFVLGVLLVFFVLAGLYESWSLPMAVILVVPMCLSSALAGVWLASMDVNIFVQVGFVVLVGLAAKNAILIVEFARDRQREGVPLAEAATEAARVRLRPIIMTSFAFILGVLPLVISHGAGAEMRRTLGTAVFSGMLGVTLFGIFLTPVFFYVIRRIVHDPSTNTKVHTLPIPDEDMR